MAGKRLTDEEKRLIRHLYFVEKKSQNFIAAKLQRGKGTVNRVINEPAITTPQKSELPVRPIHTTTNHEAGAASRRDGKIDRISLNSHVANFSPRAHREPPPTNLHSQQMSKSLKFKTNAELLRHILYNVRGVDISGIEPFLDLFVRLEAGWMMRPHRLRYALKFRFGTVPGETAFTLFQVLWPQYGQVVKPAWMAFNPAVTW